MKRSSRLYVALQRLASASSVELQVRFTNKINRWRLALLVFATVYASLLLFNLGYMSIQWDEMPHLYGGLLLTRGQTHEYLSLYGYYPPFYDIVTTGYYHLFGVSVASGRLAAVTFSLLSLWIIFEFADRAYGPRIALISSVLLGIMPGFFWLSRAAMLETMLVFFFSITLFFFFTWLSKHQDRALILSCLALGIGFLAKYQVLVAGVVMIASILLLGRDKLRLRFSKLLLVAVIAILVVVPWLFVLYQTNGVNNFGQLFYTINEGHLERTQYSTRFPAPIFYLIEVTWPYNDIHPIALPIYILGLLGLGLWAYRRKTEDKFFLTWFITVYVFFTLIPNKQWRYVTPVFPVLAISAASFIMLVYGKAAEAWKHKQISINKKRLLKVAAGLFVIFTAVSVVYSSNEAYYMVARDQIHIPIEEATSYAVKHLGENESIVVVCAFNLFNKDMVKFYLPANESKRNEVLQYPELPVDAFAPNFNLNEFIALCSSHNVKYVFLYEYGSTVPYFNTTLTLHDVYGMLYHSGRFSGISDEATFGANPRRIFVVSFIH